MSAACATQEHLHGEIRFHDMESHPSSKQRILSLQKQIIRPGRRTSKQRKDDVKPLYKQGESRIKTAMMQRNSHPPVKSDAKPGGPGRTPTRRATMRSRFAPNS